VLTQDIEKKRKTSRLARRNYNTFTMMRSITARAHYFVATFGKHG